MSYNNLPNEIVKRTIYKCASECNLVNKKKEYIQPKGSFTPHRFRHLMYKTLKKYSFLLFFIIKKL